MLAAYDVVGPSDLNQGLRTLIHDGQMSSAWVEAGANVEVKKDGIACV